MTRHKQLEQELRQDVINDLLNLPAEDFYSIFGSRLEMVVNQQKEKLTLKLKTIWRNRNWYAYKDTGEQLDDYGMSYFFDPKKINKYSLSDLETILEKMGKDLIYSNPKSSSNA